LKDERVAFLVEELFELASCLSTDFQLLEKEITADDFISPYGLKEILKQTKSGKAMLIDVREELEVKSSPVEGSLHVLTRQLKGKAGELPKNKTYYVFCRGRVCAAATDAVKILRAAGFTAYRIKESAAAFRKKVK
jgi:rhodanese-related sulfurtransferase